MSAMMSNIFHRLKLRRQTVDERAAMLRTGDEYRHAHRAAKLLAASWWVLASVLVFTVAWGAVQTVRSVYAYTDILTPRSAALYREMRDRPDATLTASRAVDLVPVDWGSQTVDYALQCRKRPICTDQARMAFTYWWNRLPDLVRIRQLVTGFFGGLVFLSVFVFVSQGDIRRWEQDEINFLGRQERNARKAARG
ncbi:hypothetical protein FNU79_17770 [Deinococcus detaillensis]|uniref:Uncharacterized protein n=1 Tax=Deinococcus detaillensis TaxID=2592048 RepID=A0A553UH50_9DEIO|nr:hypothetical protein [Deinococcus detaillensis]TSA79539.1 hypothetical protein FNU79_17770 [Deinococcus detaillensis]